MTNNPAWNDFDNESDLSLDEIILGKDISHTFACEIATQFALTLHSISDDYQYNNALLQSLLGAINQKN